MPYHFYSKIHEKFAQVARYWFNATETLQCYCRNIVVNIKLYFGVLLSFPVSQEKLLFYTFNIAPMKKIDLGLNLFWPV